MFKPEQWGGSSCGNKCTRKYSSFTQIPWRVFCKKGCDIEGDNLEDCLEECRELCYKAPVVKDQKWSAFIDRSPGSASYSEECFSACRTGCAHNFESTSEEGDQVPDEQAKPHVGEPSPPVNSSTTTKGITKPSS